MKIEKKSCKRCLEMKLAKACEVCELGASEESPMDETLYWYIQAMEEKRLKGEDAGGNICMNL